MVLLAGLATAGKALLSKAGGKIASSLGSKAFGNVAGLAGSLLGGFNSASGGGLDIAGSKVLMDYQAKLNREMTQWQNENQWKFMRTGLENADYNPLLALGATPASGAVGIATGSEGTTARGIQFNSVANALQQLSSADVNNTGALGKLFGASNAKGLYKFGSTVGNKLKRILEAKVDSALNTAKAEKTGTYLLKGYISNTASSFKDSDRTYSSNNSVYQDNQTRQLDKLPPIPY